MDNRAEDWEKQKRIKAEKEKALKESLAEDQANLVYIDPKVFAVKKGFTNNPEAHRVMAEKSSEVCLVLVVLGAVLDAILTILMFRINNLGAGAISYIEGAVFYLMLVGPTLITVVMTAAEVIAYWQKTGKKLTVPIISAIITVIIFLIYLKIRELIIMSGF